jgi:hypothetical protein
MVDDTQDKALGSGVWLGTANDGRPLYLDLRDVPRLVGALGAQGEGLLHGFLVIFAANDRLCALAQLTALNDEHSQPLLRQRNRNTLVWMTLATFKEALDAIPLLRKGGIERVVGKDYEAWRRLRAMKDRWEKDSFLHDARNIFGAHLGSGEVLAGLRSVKPGEYIRLLDHRAGNRRNDTIYPAANALLLNSLRDKRGVPYNDERFQASGHQAANDAFVFGILAEVVFCKVLGSVGVTDMLEPEKEAELLAALDLPGEVASSPATTSVLSSTDAPAASARLVATGKRIGWAPEK